MSRHAPPAYTHNQAEYVMMTRAEIAERYRIAMPCDNFRGTRYSGRGSTLYCVQRVVHWLLTLPRDRSYGQGRQQGRMWNTILYYSVSAASTILKLFSVHANAIDLAYRHELAFGSAGRMSSHQRSDGWNGHCSAALGVTPRGWHWRTCHPGESGTVPSLPVRRG